MYESPRTNHRPRILNNILYQPIRGVYCMMCKAYDDGGWERERETFEVWDEAILVDREYEKGSIWWLLHNNTS